MSQSESPVSVTAERFLREVVARIPLERIEELHLFSPLRQGTVETGIAVVAALELIPPVAAPVATDPELSLSAVDAEAPEGERETDASAEPVEASAPVARHTVYTARYRHVIKGPDRGKWEADVKAEADAPLITVETVVRGVQRRAGEESEIVRYTAPQLARLLRVAAPA